MAIGERIRFFRTMRGMTQKYLGMLMGFPEKSADIRMAQYEAEAREPKAALVEKIIPGPKPLFRCCIYKEREIVRERIRLACGQDTSDNIGSDNYVQVIHAACDECPLSAYSVTDKIKSSKIRNMHIMEGI